METRNGFNMKKMKIGKGLKRLSHKNRWDMLVRVCFGLGMFIEDRMER